MLPDVWALDGTYVTHKEREKVKSLQQRHGWRVSNEFAALKRHPLIPTQFSTSARSRRQVKLAASTRSTDISRTTPLHGHPKAGTLLPDFGSLTVSYDRYLHSQSWIGSGSGVWHATGRGIYVLLLQ